MGKKLGAGHVISLRINPTDCMGVVDVVKNAGVYTPGMSFASMVSLALTSLLQTVRDMEFIPERDGYEFNELMGPHLGKVTTQKKVIANNIKAAGSNHSVKGLSKPRQESYGTLPPVTDEQRKAGARFKELMEKKELATLGTGVVWNDTDEQELATVMNSMYR